MHIKEIFNKYGRALWKAAKGFYKENPFGQAAEIAFYTIFSMPGVLIVVVSIAGTLYDQQVVTGEVISQVSYLIGPDSAAEVRKILENARGPGNSDLIAQWIGIGTLLFSATTVFISLQAALNHIWRIRPKPKRGYVKLIIDRIMSFAMVASIGFLLLVTLVLDAGVSLLGNSIQQLIGVNLLAAEVINFTLSAVIIAVIFALMYKVLPDAKVDWEDVWAGALLATVMFMIGKYLLGFYLGNSSLGSAYGAAGSLVLLLIWVYYSSVIFLFGGLFTQVHSSESGKRIQPASNAVRIKIMEIESD